ncbi:sugar-transfer associated ATP-grasp domain-containing protein [Halapricum desulfuricans]|uniref:Sugar-transfer associated ATP-grasp domain n=1 Tax=Halapricum desulfuricans TaxID=2841257 RepID=A0A897N3R3_9EURY|nr:sugar-transfer associated ATP-grasp domain-containing protein [Halapricum desulfuricans]QSG05425.1 Sugar-transfer associated ATP-grasp domain [Halapricum desulfuricans]
MGFRTLLESIRSALATEIRGGEQPGLTWKRRLWLYRHGFLSSKDAVWDLTPGTVEQYLSDVEYRRVRGIDDPYTEALENKLLFHLLVSPTHDRLLADVYGVVMDGTFVDVPGIPETDSFEQLLGRLADTPAIAKPVQAAKGDEIRRIDRLDGQLRLDGRPIERTALYETLTDGRDRLLTEHVSQAEYAARIAPDSTNTIRFLTMIDPETGEPFVARAVHRFGTPSSGHIDNWGAGGLSAEIAPDTGTLSRAVANPHRDTTVEGWNDNHPETGTRIADCTVPGWERISASVRELAGAYGRLWPHVGWDVVVRDGAGSIAVLEGDPQSVDADVQAHGPLLADDRVRRFYRYHGVLSSERRGPA